MSILEFIHSTLQLAAERNGEATAQLAAGSFMTLSASGSRPEKRNSPKIVKKRRK